MKTDTAILNEVISIDPALGLVITRDRKRGVPDAEIFERLRAAINEEVARRERERLEDFNNPASRHHY